MKGLYPIFLALVLLASPALSEAQIITTWDHGNIGSDPNGGFFDKQGNFYFADALGAVVRKIDTACNVTIIAGTGTPGYNSDNIPANTAQLNQPNDVILDSIGNIYITDASNKRVRKIDHLTGIISTIAGTGLSTYNNDNILAVNANINPSGICFDNIGNLYICDAGNHRIRKINSSGIITTIAGNGIDACTVNGGFADTSAISTPGDICTDTFGNFYIADAWITHIYKVSVAGIITIVAGTGTGTLYNGDNISAITAQINPNKIRTDQSGKLYFVDMTPNHRIRMVDASGIIHTVAGNGTATYSGDNGPADSAGIINPSGLAFDHCGNLYVSQVGGPAHIRKVAINPTCADTPCGPKP